MRRSRALGLALLLLAVPARANTVVQGLATVSGGYNTNPTGTANPRGDWFDDIRPGLRLTSLFERGMFFAQYTFDVTMYLSHGAASGYSNDLSLGALLLTSRTTSLTLSAGVLQSQFNNIQALQASATAPVVIVPIGTQQFVSARASESISWDFTPAWQLRETSTFAATIPVDADVRQSYDLNNIIDVIRRWQRDSLGLQLRVDYVNYPATTMTGGAVIGGDDQLLNGASARWLHDFGPSFSTELMAGVLLATKAEDATGVLLEPLARAALHYRHAQGSVDLGYDHSAEPSLLTGATFANDTLALRGGVPLGAGSNMALAASLAYQHGSLFDANLGQLTSSTDVWLADLSWTWAPWRETTFFARYSFTDQIGDPSSPSATGSFQRQLVMVGVNIVYPAVAAAPTGFRASVRTDRSDAVDMPALHAPPAPAVPAPR